MTCSVNSFFFSVPKDFIQTENCISEKFLLDFDVSEEQIQHIFVSFVIKKGTGPDELHGNLFQRSPRTPANYWAIYFAKLNKHVPHLLVGRIPLLVQLSENC